jgi:hypothetical protein
MVDRVHQTFFEEVDIEYLFGHQKLQEYQIIVKNLNTPHDETGLQELNLAVHFELQRYSSPFLVTDKSAYLQTMVRNYSNVAEEEIAKQFPTERREMIFCAIHMTEKWPFFLHMMTENLRFWFWTATGDNFFFSVENQIFLFYNFNTATHGAH